MQTSNQKSAIETIYARYEYMASIYANKVFNFERHGYEKEDIVQELRIKIYTSIISYSEKWNEYKSTGRYKPVPIKYYIKAAMVNKVKDFIKQLNLETVENAQKISVQSDGFDHGHYTTMESNLDLNKCVCNINGIDLFGSLQGRKKKVFALFLKGFTVAELNQVFSNIDVELLVNRQIVYIKSQKSKLLDYKQVNYSMMVTESE